MNRVLKLTVSIGLILSLVCGCTSNGEETSSTVNLPFEEIQEYFSVPISVKVYGDNAEEATKLAFERVAQLEMIFSNTIDDSEVNYVNNNAFNGSVEISNEFKTVLEKSLYYSNLTDGAFDFTIDNLITLWGIGTDSARVPADSEISNYINLHDYENVSIENSSVTFTTDTVKLNFGAISKGYIADEMKRVLSDNGITSAILNLGGNVSTLGTKPSGKLWSVAITNPKDTSSSICTLKVNDKSVVTSGDYERYFIQDGVKYHHILDTSTGYPTDNGVSSITIIGDNGIDCDALSTACFVLGEKKALDLIEGIPNYDAIIVLDDGSIKTTSNIQDYEFLEID